MYVQCVTIEKEVIITPGNTNINIRVDAKLKEEAEQFSSQFGMTMISAVNMFLQQVVRECAVLLSLSLDSDRAFICRLIECAG